MYSEALMKEGLQDGKGVTIDGVNVTNIRYADDIAIISNNERDLQELMNKLNTACKKFGMALNTKKTKVLVIERVPGTKCEVKVGREILEQVKEYLYLGSWINEGGRARMDIKRRAGMAKNTFWKYKELMQRNINWKTKKRLLNTYVMSVFTYGAETWTINKENERNIEALEMWCIRKMLKISWKDKVNNKEVLRRAGMKRELLENIKKRKMELYGHVMRGSSGQLFKTVVGGKMEGRRGSGRPRRGWTDDVCEWSGKRKEELESAVGNRRVWRKLVGNLRHHEDAT